MDEAELDAARALEVTADAALLSGLLDKIPATVAYWDRDYRNVYANRGYVEWFGVEPADMVGRTVRDVLGERFFEINGPAMAAALDGVEQHFDRTMPDRTGRMRHVQASYMPDVKDGRVVGFVVLVFDVTARVEAQRALDEAQAIAHLGSAQVDVVSGTGQWSAELHRIFGIEPGAEEVSLDLLSSRVHPEDRDAVMGRIASAAQNATAYTSHYRILRPDGEVREIESRGRPVVGPDGVVRAVAATILDVTDSSRVSRELARTNEELRAANELNADVLAMLGHDLRTPLTSLMGYLETLEEDWDELPEQTRHEVVGRLRPAARRLHAMAERILGLARVDSGALEPLPETVDVLAAVRSALVDVGLRDAGPDEAVLDAPGAAYAVCDPQHLAQVLLNLLGNAQRYGALPLCLEVTASGSSVRIAVGDAGAGVPEERVPALFERFATGTAEQRRRGGSGFGLYVSARLAEANGGTLGYRPGPPHAFVLELPAGPSVVSSQDQGPDHP